MFVLWNGKFNRYEVIKEYLNRFILKIIIETLIKNVSSRDQKIILIL